ncbi:primosomal protein N' [Alteromonas sp. D210916BOD_24]|uniref:primosomal protein N' n=1 Tax=Alteromonas sp. D210916BOD_24 TaxID=3157618 RepID=UPI00399D1453
MAFIQVAVPVPLRQQFTYTHHKPLEAGVRVVVPFGPRKLIGVVTEVLSQHSVEDTTKLKAIIEVIDDEPVIDKVLLNMAQWLWQYYHHAPGEVIHAMLPVLLRKGESALPSAQDILTVTERGKKTSLETLSRAPKQKACLAGLLAAESLATTARKQHGAPAVKALIDKGLAYVDSRVPSFVEGAWLTQLALGDKPIPDTEQAVAIAALNRSNNQFAVSLLEGVTGSGKTEVYLQAIEPILQHGKQVLILVPEIGLTPQTVSRFEKRFAVEVGVLHSQLSDSARLQVWQRAKAGELGIIIGTRSAIFTPLKLPGMLIVDEEHDESFKQQDGLRYHARDLAVMRAKQQGIPLLLGSATPSFETLNNALSGRYTHLQLTRRAGGAKSTHQHVLDARDQPIHYGIAQGLLGIMRQHLNAGNQVLVFVNRRGYAPALLCHHCGETVMCKRCDRPYTVHKGHNRLQCHHCASTRSMPSNCAACHSSELVTAGTGTEQVEQGLASLFPGVKQVRIDSDSVRGKDKLHDTLAAINRQEYQLLVGTQILSKGHHFPHVTLVAVLDVDGALFSADFRASEKLAQLVTQLSGRAGRATKPGEMWLQTHNPHHPLLQDLVNNGYGHFARLALTERKAAGLPPFISQFVIRAEATDSQLAYGFLQGCKGVFIDQASCQINGPFPCLIEKRQGRFRFMLVCSHSKRGPLHASLRHALPFLQALPLATKVRWSVDIDPTDFS